MLRPTGITILGILHFLGGIFSAIVAVMGAAMLGYGGMGNMGYMGMYSAAIGGAFLGIFGALAVIEFVIAGALFSGKRWGRIIVIVLSIVSLLLGVSSLIVGNVFSILTIILDLIVLWYMWRPHVIAYFYDGSDRERFAPRGFYCKHCGLRSESLEILQNHIKQQHSNSNDNSKYLGILKERYAKGEISKEEFEEKKKDLE